MKTVHILFLALLMGILCSCEKDYKLSDGDYLGVPVMLTNKIEDGSVTLQVGVNQYYEFCIVDAAMIAEPKTVEIYQSDHPEDGFRKIKEFKYQGEPMSHTVSGLPNGVPVYFQIKNKRDGYETQSSPVWMFVPNPPTKSEALYTSSQEFYHSITPSPSLQKMAVVSIDPGIMKELFISSIDGTGIKKIEVLGDNPSWFDNEKKILFSISKDHNNQIATYDCETEETTVLLHSDKDFYGVPVISNDGNKVLYQLNNGINLYDISTKENSQMMVGNDMIYDPSWIDNETFLFSQHTMDPYSSIICFGSISGEKRKMFDTAYARYDRNPIMSPDGEHIVFTSDRSGTYEIWLYNIKNKQFRQLTGHNNSPDTYTYRNRIGWLDNSHIYYTESYNRLMKLSVK